MRDEADDQVPKVCSVCGARLVTVDVSETGQAAPLALLQVSMTCVEGHEVLRIVNLARVEAARRARTLSGARP